MWHKICGIKWTKKQGDPDGPYAIQTLRFTLTMFERFLSIFDPFLRPNNQPKEPQKRDRFTPVLRLICDICGSPEQLNSAITDSKTVKTWSKNSENPPKNSENTL